MFLLNFFKLRLLFFKKLRLSASVFCVLSCFLDLGFESFCGLRLLGWPLVLLAFFLVVLYGWSLKSFQATSLLSFSTSLPDRFSAYPVSSSLKSFLTDFTAAKWLSLVQSVRFLLMHITATRISILQNT